MKIICWITEDWALDTDLNIVPFLKKMELYQIHWYVLTKNKKELNTNFSSLYKVINIPYRFRDPRIIGFFMNLFADIHLRNADIIYSSAMGIPFYYPVLLNYKKKNQPLIHAAHNVIPYSVWPLSMRLTVKYLFNINNNFQFFSRFTYKWFLERYHNKNAFYAPMIIKNYGNIKTNKYCFDKKKINLLFFGNVAGNKRLDLLIEAVKRLPVTIKNKVHLNICGNCKENKDLYLKQIANDNAISVFFNRIPDEDIPELFINSSYLVLPYEDVAQSGPHMIAYNYNLPVIASNLDGFTERIENNVNGFIFEEGNLNSLIEVIVKAINIDDVKYIEMKNNLKSYVNDHFSVNAVAKRYIEYFNSL